jgi:hypothetical protein
LEKNNYFWFAKSVKLTYQISPTQLLPPPPKKNLKSQKVEEKLKWSTNKDNAISWRQKACQVNYMLSGKYLK